MKHYHIIFTVRIFSETCRGPVARLLLRRPQSLRSGRVVVVAMAVLAEVVVVLAEEVLVLAEVVVVMAEEVLVLAEVVVVMAEVVLLDDSVHVAIVPCLSYSYFYHVSCLALL